MSILPLLICIYLASNYILPYSPFKFYIILAILITIFIAVIGFILVREIFSRILSVCTEAKLIAAGDISRKVETSREDEVGDLADSLNHLTQNIRSNMDELKSYGEKTTAINIEIQKRILAVSSLLQISSLISQGATLDDILKLTVEKSRLLGESEVAYLLLKGENSDDNFYMRAVDGGNANYLLAIRIDSSDSVFNKLIKNRSFLILDKENPPAQVPITEFYEKFRLKNTMAYPVYLKGKLAGILGVGNTRENFSYTKDDIELLDIFAKQISIAVENDVLIRQVEILDIKDALTGLYNRVFICNRLQEEIKRAIVYQRPCSFVLLNIDNFQKFRRDFDLLEVESILKKVASLIRESVSDIDRVARFGDNEFAIVLPEKTKRQAQKIAEEIRVKIEGSFSNERYVEKRFTVSGGLSENPLDGVTADELIGKAKELLDLAKEQGKNRIEA
jgi:diguanylate cyclase (GGDEF)-like protein